MLFEWRGKRRIMINIFEITNMADICLTIFVQVDVPCSTSKTPGVYSATYISACLNTDLYNYSRYLANFNLNFSHFLSSLNLKKCFFLISVWYRCIQYGKFFYANKISEKIEKVLFVALIMQYAYIYWRRLDAITAIDQV